MLIELKYKEKSQQFESDEPPTYAYFKQFIQEHFQALPEVFSVAIQFKNQDFKDCRDWVVSCQEDFEGMVKGCREMEGKVGGIQGRIFIEEENNIEQDVQVEADNVKKQQKSKNQKFQHKVEDSVSATEVTKISQEIIVENPPISQIKSQPAQTQKNPLVEPPPQDSMPNQQQSPQQLPQHPPRQSPQQPPQQPPQQTTITSSSRPRDLTFQQQMRNQILAQQQQKKQKSRAQSSRADINSLREQLAQNQKLEAQRQKNKEIDQKQKILAKKWIGDTNIRHDEQCMECKDGKICGIMYRCSVCAGYNLCGRCYNKTEHRHPFLKVKKGGKFEGKVDIQFRDQEFDYRVKAELGRGRDNTTQQQRPQPRSQPPQVLTYKPSNNTVHNKIKCSECKLKQIQGYRYKCSICQNYNLCQGCQPKTKHDHPFLKIKDFVKGQIVVTSRFQEDMVPIAEVEESEAKEKEKGEEMTEQEKKKKHEQLRKKFPYMFKTPQEEAREQQEWDKKIQQRRKARYIADAPKRRWVGDRSIQHDFVQCKDCYVLSIRGARYKCAICPNVDLCGNCFHTTKHDKSHPFLKIRQELKKKKVITDIEMQNGVKGEQIQANQSTQSQAKKLQSKPQQKQSQIKNQQKDLGYQQQQMRAQALKRQEKERQQRQQRARQQRAREQRAREERARLQRQQKARQEKEQSERKLRQHRQKIVQEARLAKERQQRQRSRTNNSQPQTNPTTTRNPGFQPPKTSQTNVIHYGIGCDECNSKDIKGIRYKCVVCPDFDLCQQCEATSTHDHPLIKIKKRTHSVQQIDAIVGIYSDEPNGYSNQMRNKYYQLIQQRLQRQKDRNQCVEYLMEKTGMNRSYAEIFVRSNQWENKEDILEKFRKALMK